MAWGNVTTPVAGPEARWRALRQAVREAIQLGAAFRIVGDTTVVAEKRFFTSMRVIG